MSRTQLSHAKPDSAQRYWRRCSGTGPVQVHLWYNRARRESHHVQAKLHFLKRGLCLASWCLLRCIGKCSHLMYVFPCFNRAYAESRNSPLWQEIHPNRILSVLQHWSCGFFPSDASALLIISRRHSKPHSGTAEAWHTSTLAA